MLLRAIVSNTAVVSRFAWSSETPLPEPAPAQKPKSTRKTILGWAVGIGVVLLAAVCRCTARCDSSHRQPTLCEVTLPAVLWLLVLFAVVGVVWAVRRMTFDSDIEWDVSHESSGCASRRGRFPTSIRFLRLNH